MSSSKTIAKNTMFLYFRMFLTMGVGLYTSRIVLNALGVVDYGVYSIVGGIVTLFSFFNGAMSSATQRYLAIDIEKKNMELLRKTFNSVLLIHVGIAFLILVLAETIGLWYVNKKLNIPIDRIDAVNWIYQFSVLAALVGVIQVPFNALIIAREKMNVYAFLSIIDAVLKLIVAFFLITISYDKLILYSVLVALVTILIAIAYLVYCNKFFIETKFKIYTDKIYYKELISYSGWNLFGNIAAVAKGQGVNLVLNIFFGTIINAAYGITMQVQAAVSMFVNNFQLAVNPQIIKTYAQENIEQTHKLIYLSSKFSFFLMILITSPILLNTEYILKLWLKNPPPYSTIFVQLCLINILIDCVSGPLMTGIQATGKIKQYQVVVGLLLFLNLPISYLILKITNTPSHVFIISVLISIVSLQFRLYFLNKTLNFNITGYYIEVILKMLIISAIIASYYYILKQNIPFTTSFLSFSMQSIVVLLLTLLLIIFLGINKAEKKFILNFIIKNN